MAISWTLLLVRFHFGWRTLPGKAAGEIANLPFSQARNGENPYRAQGLAQTVIPRFTGSSGS
jgi:hypothetical protein